VNKTKSEPIFQKDGCLDRSLMQNYAIIIDIYGNMNKDRILNTCLKNEFVKKSLRIENMFFLQRIKDYGYESKNTGAF